MGDSAFPMKLNRKIRDTWLIRNNYITRKNNFRTTVDTSILVAANSRFKAVLKDLKSPCNLERRSLEDAPQEEAARSAESQLSLLESKGHAGTRVYCKIT